MTLARKELERLMEMVWAGGPASEVPTDDYLLLAKLAEELEKIDA